ncbi:MAG: gamma-glutamylcyclotransferase family protein [Aeromicrobium sp.]|uniref:gamma-glutamylcyclotransferase family protein n=1 Tax=Aeromicrobium sp. TaxID=1871063 RepID=UPI0039E40B94
MSHLVFSYGTLAQAGVQLEIFGGPVPADRDAVVGYTLGEVVIDDPAVVALSGAAVHPGLIASDDPGAEVEGVVLMLDDAQLAAADDYEVDAYRRIAVPLRSGRTAWVYALA